VIETTAVPSGRPPSSVACNEDNANATILVDNLLEYTQSLMEEGEASSANSRKTNAAHLPMTVNHIIAFSGGVDSSVVAALVHQVSRSSTSSKDDSSMVTAVLGLSPAVPSDQIRLAEQVAAKIGVRLEQILTTEGEDEIYIANNGQACLACKTHLYTCLSRITKHYGGDINNRNSGFRLYNGTNADDLKDPTRLGLIAADKFHVRSPLYHTPKEKVRIAARHLGLPNWDYAASPCLRSRLALGVEALPQHLAKIERAESFVRRTLMLDPRKNMRVRLLSRNRAMIEVDQTILDKVQTYIHNDETWKHFFIEVLGFMSLHVRPFKTGSVAKQEAPNSSSNPSIASA
jgi:uncharacterized protein